MYFYGLIISIIFLIITIRLLITRSLNLGISILWLFVDVIFIILSLNRYLIEIIAKIFKIYYSPSVIFMIGILFSFQLILYLMVVISKMHLQIIKLTQEVGLLKLKYNDERKTK